MVFRYKASRDYDVVRITTRILSLNKDKLPQSARIPGIEQAYLGSNQIIELFQLY